jgi:hypothetical protein
MDPASPASEPAAEPVPSDLPVDAPGADPAAVDPTDPLAVALDPAASAAVDPAAEPAAAAKPKADLTARLASMSRKAREAAIKARTAEQAAEAATAKLADLDARLDAARKDPTKVKELLAMVGLDFRKVVDVYAETPDLTPEQQANKLLADTRNEVAELKKSIEADATKATEQKNAAALAERLAEIGQAVAKAGDKAEICARLGEEASRDIFGIVTDAWNRAGRPVLDPGEFEDAVNAAIEKQEMIYEDRGKKLAKKSKTIAAEAAVAATKTKSGLPKGLVREDEDLSEKDKKIVEGLIDMTAPAAGSQRTKPRTIGSAMGGSAPPRATPSGEQDPRDALRDVLALA